MRAGLLAAAGCVVAAAVMAQLPYLALPVCAAALADISLRGRPIAAAVLAGATTALSALLWGPRGAAIAVVGLAGVLAAIAWLDRGSPWTALITLGVGYTVTFVAIDAADAWLAGESLIEGLRSLAESNSEVAATVARLAGVEAAAGEAQGLSETLFMTWPASYVVTGTVTAILVVSAIGWMARRHGRERNALPPLSQIDVSPHVLWLPLAGVASLVAARFVDSNSAILAAVGWNALLVAWPLFAWQGFAVVTSKLGQFSVAPALRVVAYVAAALLEVLLFAVSLLGFVDIMANFRKLSRADSPPRGGAEGPASSI
jgi:uncharacterized protein YybS (DUF2232 family)